MTNILADQSFTADQNFLNFTANYPLSGFKTPKINSDDWDETGDNKGNKRNDFQLLEASPTNRWDPYPAWSSSELVPVSIEEVEGVFLQLTDIFGFQIDNTRNMFDYFMTMLDSRSSRMGPTRALRSIHADYIGGTNANYRKWYFAAQLDIDDEIGFSNLKPNGKPKDKSETIKPLEEAEMQWGTSMSSLSPIDKVIQLALYLLCWGEANNIRFMPECLCFIFKCCNDYYYSLEPDMSNKKATKNFLDHVITPLYNFYRDQLFHKSGNGYTRTNKDHEEIITYDDINQLFWYSKGLRRLVLDDKRRILDIDPQDRYLYLGRVNWNKAFFKTFKESRSWSHVVCNFNRIWTIHISMFWYYTSFSAPTFYTYKYNPSLNNQPTIQARLTVMALGGAISCFLCLVATICEWRFIPRKYPGAEPLLKRFNMLIFLLTALVAPTIYLLGFVPLNHQSTSGILVASTQFTVSIVVLLYLTFVPLSKLFRGSEKRSRRFLADAYFVLNFHKLKGSEHAASILLWIVVFFCKFLESYFFLTLSLRDPMRELSIIKIQRCAGDKWLGNVLCKNQNIIVLVLIIITDLVLFFLDTYLWYIVCNTIFSILRSFYIGISVWTPWRNIFSRLPKRIFSKIIFAPSDGRVKGKHLTSQVWNSIIISMYREHFLAIEHVQKLIYKQVVTGYGDDETMLKEPSFFVSQEDMTMKSTLFYELSEAQRRITFFAQSLSTPMREIRPIGAIPSFTVLIPHYTEKIIFSLKEIIREEDQYSNITMLEYLKNLHPLEWTCFVRDTRLLAEEFDSEASPSPEEGKKSDLYYESVGFKVATPEYILRTRIWASLRAQTLYRTVSGFMNYSRAIKLLFDVENGNEDFIDAMDKLDEASALTQRKFRMIVSMQRYKYFTPQEAEDTEFLLRTYPELQISYLDEEIDIVTGETIYYSSLIDGSCSIKENGDRIPKYRIRLSGNPIMGDGKSDNQNHSVIFTRGEYIQLIDANQDNYLEECLKVRSILEDFDEQIPPINPFEYNERNQDYQYPVAIIGTREYIFSENIGILGDIAAGKEQTFGTLFARTLAHIGGKLHYGHPDFLNAIFMTTRGGVSKGQKGLHLNEDVYAGMNVLCRGGRINYCEYMQCGKGRDLGFGSILNFTTKIGAGMGEQMLSREHFYLSTKLPLDRFLSYYYAHPGFHLNNAFIILSIKMFLVVGINIASMVSESIICEYNKNIPITDPKKPTGCYNLVPVVHWLERSVLSIFIVFAISFLPLFVQDLMERGLYKTFTRLGKHMLCLSPLFEVFICRAYSESLTSDMLLGGASYIATGRGFATVRVPFALLYSRFALPSLYYGAISTLLILCTSIKMWKLPLLYFWISVVGFILCPWIFNPNQFSFNDFFLDYRLYLQWLSRGNTKSRLSSWIGFTRLNRSRITGLKDSNKVLENSELKFINHIKPSRFNILVTGTIFDLLQIVSIATAYLFDNSLNDSRYSPSSSLIRLLILSFGPIIVNMAILSLGFLFSCLTGPLLTVCFSKYPSIIAATVHSLAVLNYVAFFEFFWFLQNFSFSGCILGLATAICVQRWFLKILLTLFVSREFRNDTSNITWWSGKWFTAGLGFYMFTQPLREFLCKTSELSYFVADIFLGHSILYIQIPLLCIPYIDKWHTLMLFWLKPSSQLRPRILSKKQRTKIRRAVRSSLFVFILGMILYASIFVAPMVAVHVFHIDFEDYVGEFIKDLIQKRPVNSMRKGLHKGIIKHYK